MSNYFVHSATSLASPNGFPEKRSSSSVKRERDFLTQREAERILLAQERSRERESHDDDDLESSENERKRDGKTYDYSESVASSDDGFAVVGGGGEGSRVSNTIDYAALIVDIESIVKTVGESINRVAMRRGKDVVSSFEDLATVSRVILELVGAKTGERSVDSHLSNALKAIVFRHSGAPLLSKKDSITSSLSEVLYDEMVYQKIIQHISESYEKDLFEIEKNRGKSSPQIQRLLVQKEADVSRLSSQRIIRLSRETEVKEIDGNGSESDNNWADSSFATSRDDESEAAMKNYEAAQRQLAALEAELERITRKK